MFSFGGAAYFGSMGGKSLKAAIVGIAVAPGGVGYWEVAADGGIFSFGNAPFYGSMGGKSLKAPIVGIAVDPMTGGYWEVAADGGIFSFNAPFYGSMGANSPRPAFLGSLASNSLSGGVVGIAASGSSGGGLQAGAGKVTPGVLGYCAVLSTGGIECWGYNGGYSAFPGLGGYLGNGSTVIYSDVPVPAIGITNAKSIAGDYYGYCAVLSTGGIDCWGYNGDGELGDGTESTYSNVPVAVIDGEAALLGNAVSVVGGNISYCAVLSNGGVDCWGSDAYGELGDGVAPPPSGSSDVPVTVGSKYTKISDALSIAGGSGSYCAVLSTGGIDCWGYNASGQLGDGSTVNANYPFQVETIGDAVSIVSDWGSFCATLTTGALDCWGDNYDGSLGAGLIAGYSDIPVSVPLTSSVAKNPPPPPSAPPAVTYDALGDSFSSGEGTGPPYLGAGQDGSVAASDTSSDQCHRSAKAYSEDIVNTWQETNGWNLVFAACSGATTSDVLSFGQHGEGKQVSRVKQNHPDLVTLTVRGDDAGFSHVLKHCIWQDVSTGYGSWGDQSCADSMSYRRSVEAAIGSTFQKIENTLASIRSNAGPNASVIYVGYPALFPTQSQSQTCGELSWFLTTADQNFFNKMAALLDFYEMLAASDMGVNFVDVQSVFAHHGVCGSKGSWINGVTSTNFSLTDLGGTFGGSFHPNASGQSGYAAAVTSYVDDVKATGVALNTGGFPFNPAPNGASGGVASLVRRHLVTPALAAEAVRSEHVTPSESYGGLSVQSSGTGSNVVSTGALRPGQMLKITGSGFAPRAKVKVTISSPGVGSGMQMRQLLATVTATSSGSIDVVVRVPVHATGFGVPRGAIPSNAGGGAGENLAFFDAVGTGKASHHVDDIAMVALTPGAHASPAALSSGAGWWTQDAPRLRVPAR